MHSFEPHGRNSWLVAEPAATDRISAISCLPWCRFASSLQGERVQQRPGLLAQPDKVPPRDAAVHYHTGGAFEPGVVCLGLLEWLFYLGTNMLSVGDAAVHRHTGGAVEFGVASCFVVMFLPWNQHSSCGRRCSTPSYRWGFQTWWRTLLFGVVCEPWNQHAFCGRRCSTLSYRLVCQIRCCMVLF